MKDADRVNVTQEDSSQIRELQRQVRMLRLLVLCALFVIAPISLMGATSHVTELNILELRELRFRSPDVELMSRMAAEPDGPQFRFNIEFFGVDAGKPVVLTPMLVSRPLYCEQRGSLRFPRR